MREPRGDGRGEMEVFRLESCVGREGHWPEAATHHLNAKVAEGNAIGHARGHKARLEACRARLEQLVGPEGGREEREVPRGAAPRVRSPTPELARILQKRRVRRRTGRAGRR